MLERERERDALALSDGYMEECQYGTHLLLNESMQEESPRPESWATRRCCEATQYLLLDCLAQPCRAV